MIYEDTYRIRQFNEIKIQQECQSVDALKKGLKESNEQTNRMTNLLNNFETKLSALHDLIVPVYDATNSLQIKYSNLQKIVSKLDNIIEFHDSVKNLSLVVQAGPGKDIKNYLLQLNKLKSAIEYFASNKNQSLKTENEELWEKGKKNVEREFEILLGKFSNINLQNLDLDQPDNNNDNSGIFNSKENDLNQMIYIIEWFKKEADSNSLGKLYDNLIKFRSQLILDEFKKIRDKGDSIGNSINSMSYGGNLSNLTNNSNLLNGKRGSLAPLSPSTVNLNSSLNGQDNEKKNTLRSRLTENLFNSSSDIKKKTLKPGLNLNDSYSNSSSAANKTQSQTFYEQDFETTDCIKFVQYIRKIVIMFKIETMLIFRLIEEDDKITACRILERIFDPVLKFLNVEAERISNNVKQINKKCTAKYILAVFKVLTDMVDMKRNLLKIFEQSTIITKTTRHLSNSIQLYLEVFIKIEKACVQSLRDVIEEVKNDSQAVQPNGNIHPVTTDTISFIENILPFDVIAGFISSVVVSENQNQMVPSEVEINLRREASSANSTVFNKIAYQVESNSEKKNYRVALAEYFYKLLKWLNLNLKKKADNYEDQTLRNIFLLNNNYKILKLVEDLDNCHLINSSPALKQKQLDKCQNLSELFILAHKNDIKRFYESEILNFKREYSKCWSKLLSYIQDLNENNPFGEKLKDKDRQILKDRFSGFNKEFEEIYETQKKYFIPSDQVAKMLREDNIIYIISQYKKFYDYYSKLNFATNREKYVKYQPEILRARIQEFFTAF